MRNSVIAGLVTILLGLSSGAWAEALGTLKSIDSDKQGVAITTDDRAQVKIEVVKNDVIRILAARDKALFADGDKKTSIVLGQKRPAVPFSLQDNGDYRLLRTDAVALRIYTKPLKFAAYKPDNKTLIWRELKPIDLSAEGSYQTLSSGKDEQFFGGGLQNGQYAFKGKVLEISYSGGWEEGDRPSPAPFYMSTAGYGVLRNTWSNGSYDFRSEGYITTRHTENRFDGYFFFGDTIKKVLAEYTALTGRAPLLPRWAFEYGDADCYNDGDNVKKPGTVPEGWSDGPTGKTPDVIESVAAKYRKYDMPGGWILPNDGYGCGYSDLPKVVKGLAKYGFKTGLWTENGVKKIAWEVGTAGTRAQKLDVAWTGKGYQFAMDANAQAASGILDNSDSRPFIWTVMGWAGIQRYAVAWTGDQSGSWDYIRWHVPTLIGAGLSGMNYATGDVDGIFGGSPETFTRDLQWKSFTPVLMGMSGWSKKERKHPWWFEEPYRGINRDYLKLKMRLMPYMYTYAWQAEQTGAPIIRGLMWDHPEDPNTYTEKYEYQFFLGKDFLVAPVYRSQVASKGWRQGIHLPQGTWIDYWDGRVSQVNSKAGMELNYPVTLEKTPVMVRGGAIIPMYPAALYDGQVPKDELTLDLYPLGDSHFTLYEDDGNTRAYKKGSYSLQDFTMSAPQKGAGDVRVQIAPVKGDYNGREKARVYRLQVHTRVKPKGVTLNNRALPQLANKAGFDAAAEGWWFDPKTQYGVVYVKTRKVPVEQSYTFALQIDPKLTLAATKPYPKMPKRGNDISSDSFIVLNRPAEEKGFPLENAFDGKPGTWFRSVRDQSVKTGAIEFSLAFNERRLITGFEIQPRNDKYWRYGQVRDYEIYMADSNGNWGKALRTGTLEAKKGMQKVTFAPIVGRMLRLRITSTQDQNDAAGNDPMVLASQNNKDFAPPYNAIEPVVVNPVTIAEFKLLGAKEGEHKQNVYLADLPTASKSANVAVLNAANKDKVVMRVNGLQFQSGLQVKGDSRVDFNLPAGASLFRADIGIDDSCRDTAAMGFQIYGDGRLLYSSGKVKAPAFQKPEIDVRTLKSLSLRTSGDSNSCGNWANALVVTRSAEK
ncbi:TIM-barrel domain-containing protein [Microbulbifer sp. SAOS-129_SWC]|uniref:TIM-barrel domain-containing protein n=1 Tax=Microbulbifer sp. SAOS-129_SWC TaxID=3145235 RepID=UPI003217DF6F